jgi:hypothetical protein
MQPWLLIAAAVHAAAANFGTQVKSLAPSVIGAGAGHQVDWRLTPGLQSQSMMFRQIDLERQVAPGAEVGLGMSRSSDAANDPLRLRQKTAPRRSQGPAVNFVLKF